MLVYISWQLDLSKMLKLIVQQSEQILKIPSLRVVNLFMSTILLTILPTVETAVLANL